MLFNSVHFLIFLPVVFCLHYALPRAQRWKLLLAASYYFYLSWNPYYGILLAGTSLIDWYAALRIERASERVLKKFWLGISLVSNLGCLAFFKYSAFIANSVLSAGSLITGQNYTTIEAFIIPVGLSFYTFQSVAYTIDVYRGHAIAEKNAAWFCYYVSFFPQLVAGPVERYNHLMPQLKSPALLNTDDFIAGFRLALWGFFKKIAIADRLSDIVNPVFHEPEHYQGFTLLVAGFFFVVQVYCDFSGYSDIATGISKWFGVQLNLNWRRPLLSGSLTEFWKRNHISMTSWFRDYLYISLGGSRVSIPRYYINLLLTFVISGLWHGASWTFAVWGALHGVFYILEIFLKRNFSFTIRFQPYLLLFHTLSLIAFRAESFNDLSVIYGRIFSPGWNFSESINELRTVHDLFPLVLSLLMIVFLFLKELQEEYGFIKQSGPYARILRPAFYVLLFVLLFTAGNFNSNEFIYFSF